METDHISEEYLMRAYNQGWNSFPDTRRNDNPFVNGNPILYQSWDQGWLEHQRDEWDSVSKKIRKANR